MKRRLIVLSMAVIILTACQTENIKDVHRVTRQTAPFVQYSPHEYEEPISPAPTPVIIAEIDPGKPMVALTFDDGPSKVTPRILALLKLYHAKATFCVVGDRICRYPDALRQILDQGSEIIGHSWDHKQLTKLSVEEIKAELTETNDAIFANVGLRPTFYRPPYGDTNDSVKAVSCELGLTLINWSIDTLDWESRDADAVYNVIIDQVNDGAIILCHDLYRSTGDAMERVIPKLTADGYQLVTISELLRFSTEETTAGDMVYYQVKNFP